MFFLVAILLIGIGQILLLPAFEGFDETAHFSRIREASSSFKTIFDNESYIDKVIVDYRGPMPYSSGDPPFDAHMTYHKFFSNSEYVANYEFNYISRPFNKQFTPSEAENWQKQHPPLYYALMSFIYPHIQKTSLKDQFFVLRALSFLIAIIGISFSLSAIKDTLKSLGKPHIYETVLLSFLIYPSIFPMFFVEFGRIGNDSLCMLLSGFLALQLSTAFANGFNYKNAIIIGSTLGLGMLTKAFFIPISIIVFTFASNNILKSQKQKTHNRPYKLLLSMFVPFMVIGCTWYIWKLYSFGDLGVGDEANTVTNKLFLWHQFINNFSFGSFLHSIATPLITYSWAGSQSLVRIPMSMQISLLFFECCMLFLYMSYLWKNKTEILSWLPISLFLVFYLALVAHVVIGIALTGLGASGGWYFHILFPWMAIGFGLGLSLVINKKVTKKLIYFFVTIALIIQFLINYLQASLFAGCAVKGVDKYYNFLNPIFCLGDWVEYFSKLQILSFPTQGTIFLTLGSLLLYFTTIREVYLHKDIILS